jgi:hypothetical protein
MIFFFFFFFFLCFFFSFLVSLWFCAWILVGRVKWLRSEMSLMKNERKDHSSSCVFSFSSRCFSHLFSPPSASSTTGVSFCVEKFPCWKKEKKCFFFFFFCKHYASCHLK